MFQDKNQNLHIIRLENGWALCRDEQIIFVGNAGYIRPDLVAASISQLLALVQDWAAKQEVDFVLSKARKQEPSLDEAEAREQSIDQAIEEFNKKKPSLQELILAIIPEDRDECASLNYIFMKIGSDYSLARIKAALEGMRIEGDVVSDNPHFWSRPKPEDINKPKTTITPEQHYQDMILATLRITGPLNAEEIAGRCTIRIDRVNEAIKQLADQGKINPAQYDSPIFAWQISKPQA